MFKIANRFSNKFKKGFTLLELTVVLTIASIVLALGISSVGKVLQSKGDGLSEEHMDKIRTALERYKVSTGRYPCPAPINVEITDGDFGKEALLTIGTPADGNVCYRSPSAAYNNAQTLGSEGFVRVFDASATNDAERWNRSVIIGAIPVQELGIDKKYATDKWGNKLVYAVTEKLAADTSNITSSTLDNPSGPPTALDKEGAIRINDTLGNTVAARADYVVISNGSDGNGAFNANATTQGTCVTAGIGSLEQENCDFTNNIFTASGTYNKSENANYFFDLVRWDSFSHSDLNVSGGGNIKNDLTIQGMFVPSTIPALNVAGGATFSSSPTGGDNNANINIPLSSTQGATFSGGTTGTTVNNALNSTQGATFTGAAGTNVNNALNSTQGATFSGGGGTNVNNILTVALSALFNSDITVDGTVLANNGPICCDGASCSTTGAITYDVSVTSSCSTSCSSNCNASSSCGLSGSPASSCSVGTWCNVDTWCSTTCTPNVTKNCCVPRLCQVASASGGTGVVVSGGGGGLPGPSGPSGPQGPPGPPGGTTIEFYDCYQKNDNPSGWLQEMCEAGEVQTGTDLNAGGNIRIQCCKIRVN
jgi:prepilin-type N-terminal cleavage/methylation domain-containing protein